MHLENLRRSVRALVRDGATPAEGIRLTSPCERAALRAVERQVRRGRELAAARSDPPDIWFAVGQKRSASDPPDIWFAVTQRPSASDPPDIWFSANQKRSAS